MSSLLDMVRKEVNRAVVRAGAVARRGVLGAAVSSDNDAQVSGPGGDDFAGVESWQHFGFRSRPPVSGEVLLVLPYGRGEGAIICAEHDRAHVPSCAASEVVVYGYGAGGVQALLRMRPDGNVWLVPGTGQVIDAGAAGTSVDFALKGTTFDTALRLVLLLIGNTWASAGAAFTAAGSAFTGLGGEGALSPGTQALCTTAGTACSAVGAFATAMVAQITTFLAGVYLCTKVKVS